MREKPSKSIRQKLVRSTTWLLIAIFLLVTTVVLVFNIFNAQTQLEKVQKSIRSSLEAKGNLLVSNNSLALRGMADDFAISDMQALVKSTVESDEDVISGIYMDTDRKPWVHATQFSNLPITDIILNDSVSLWVASLKQIDHRDIIHPDGHHIEFAAPVTLDGEIVGFIRYGLSTKAMLTAMTDAKQESRRRILFMVFTLLGLGLVVVFMGHAASRKVAKRISSPIVHLAEMAKTISEGDYELNINVKSDDEIGQLAQNFDIMRQTVKNFTDHLQELVDEKIQQVRDIMDNIDQGLFTINLDGSVNEEYSMSANRILMVDELSRCSLNDIFRLTPELRQQFQDWLDLVKASNTQMRWEKLLRLCPVKEVGIHLPVAGATRYISLSYQKILDRSGDLTRIMVLALDITSQRNITRRMEIERLRHEADMKTILAIAGLGRDEVENFLEDSRERMEKLFPAVSSLFHNESGELNDEQFFLLFRNLHTLKGNAGSFGFEHLGELSHFAENLLEELKEDEKEDERTDLLFRLQESLRSIDSELDQVDQKFEMLTSGEGGKQLCISKSRMEELLHSAKNIDLSGLPKPVAETLCALRTLRHKSLPEAFSRYENLCERLGDRLHKKIRFLLSPQNGSIHPDLLSALDEALVHIFRNCMDHGIETPEERKKAGKTKEGVISVALTELESEILLEISDDGRGINREALRQKIFENNPTDMNDEELLQLVFRDGLSTAQELTALSGRGVGMGAVRKSLQEINGNIRIESKIGNGTTFAIRIPRNNYAWSP